MTSSPERMASLRTLIGTINCHPTCHFQCSVVELHFDMRNQLSNINTTFLVTRLYSWVCSLTSMRSGSWTHRFQNFQFAEPVRNSNAHTLNRVRLMFVTQSSAWMTMRNTAFRTFQIRQILSTFVNTCKPISNCLLTKTLACSQQLSASSGDGTVSFATAVISALGKSRA